MENKKKNSFDNTRILANATTIRHLAAEYFYMACTPNSKKSKMPKYIKWIPPKLGSIKLNTDGTSIGVHGLEGTDGVLRNSIGHWIMGFAGTTTASDAMEREQIALLRGLQMTVHLNLQPFEINIDALEVINILHDHNSHCSHVISDCRFLLHQLHNPPVMHTYME